MTLKQWFDANPGVTYQKFGNWFGITKQQVHQYVTKFSSPSLELALLIFVRLDGAVPLYELLAPKKRRRTKEDEKILIVNDWSSDIIISPW